MRPTHSLVRPRVVTHATAALASWQRVHVRGDTLRANPVDLGRITSIWRSYLGHFEHAAAHRLIARLLARFPWLPSATRTGRRFPPSAMRRAVTLTWPTT